VPTEAPSQKPARSSRVQRRTTSVPCRPSPRGTTSPTGSSGPMDLPRPMMPRPQRGLLACSSELAVGFQRCTPLPTTGNQGTKRKNRALVSDNSLGVVHKWRHAILDIFKNPPPVHLHGFFSVLRVCCCRHNHWSPSQDFNVIKGQFLNILDVSEVLRRRSRSLHKSDSYFAWTVF